MEQGKVSIIMPAYNAAAFLDRSITSVRNQIYENWELLIVDDGSTDSSREIVQGYSAQDPRIRLLCNQHGGTAKARNTAIEVAQGEFFSFIDADDVYHPQYLAQLVATALREKSDMVICGIAQGTDFDAFLQSNVENAYTVLDVDRAFAAMYGGEWALMISPCNKLYARHLFDTLRFPDGRFFEDLATVNFAVYDSNKICVIREELYFYVVTPNSASKTKRSIELLDREWALRSHWEFFLQENRKNLVYLALPFYMVELITIYHRIEMSDKPEDRQLIRNQFDKIYKKYHRRVKFTQKQKDRILAFRHPNLYDIRNMIRQDGFAGTFLGFVKRKMDRK